MIRYESMRTCDGPVMVWAVVDYATQRTYYRATYAEAAELASRMGIAA